MLNRLPFDLIGTDASHATLASKIIKDAAFSLGFPGVSARSVLPVFGGNGRMKAWIPFTNKDTGAGELLSVGKKTHARLEQFLPIVPADVEFYSLDKTNRAIRTPAILSDGSWAWITNVPNGHKREDELKVVAITMQFLTWQLEGYVISTNSFETLFEDVYSNLTRPAEVQKSVNLHVKHGRVLQSYFRKPCTVIWPKINLDIIGLQPDQYHGDTFTRKFELRINSPDRTAILPIIEIYEQLLSYDNNFVVAWSGAAQMADYVNHQVRLGK